MLVRPGLPFGFAALAVRQVINSPRISMADPNRKPEPLTDPGEGWNQNAQVGCF
jgi:hypothetical protein